MFRIFVISGMILFNLLCSSTICAQLNAEDPLFRNYKLNPNGEFITLYGGDTTITFRVFDATGDITSDSLIERYNLSIAGGCLTLGMKRIKIEDEIIGGIVQITQHR